MALKMKPLAVRYQANYSMSEEDKAKFEELADRLGTETPSETIRRAIQLALAAQKSMDR